MIIAHKYRIYPYKSQITKMENHFSMLRHLYNWSLQERIDVYEKDGKSINYYDQANALTQLKIDRPWFKDVYSQVLQKQLKILDQAFQNFFRGCKSGENIGFPKFLKKGELTSMTYPQFNNKPKDGLITIPKIGKVKVVYHRDIPEESKIKTLTVKVEAGDKWFVCFSIEIDSPVEFKLTNHLDSIGIDMGLNDFIYDSDGNHIEAPKFFRKLEKKLSKLQRRLANSKKFSKQWYKIKKAISKVFYRIRCQRNDFFHKLANRLLSNVQVVCCEKLNIKNMTKRVKSKQDEQTKQYLPNGQSAKSGLNKSILDAGWGTFLTILESKAIKFGKLVVKVPAAFTSQKCSSCGEIVKKSLSIRTHKCSSCGLVLNRDHNAAINIKTLGLKSLGISPLEAHSKSFDLV